MFAPLPMICAIDFSAAVTVESVHLILWAERALYFATPACRR